MEHTMNLSQHIHARPAQRKALAKEPAELAAKAESL
jgi:hypothetical protein